MAPIDRPVKKLPIQPVSGKCSAVSMPVPVLAGEGPLEGAEQADAEGDAEDGELDVVGLPEGRAEEAAAATVLAGGRARVVLLPDRHQHEDAEMKPAKAKKSVTHS